MNTFLSEDEHNVLWRMSRLRNVSVINSKGNKALKRAFLQGINPVIISGVKLNRGASGVWYFVVTFTREGATIDGKREYFAPLDDNIFYPREYHRVQQLAEAFGHMLVPKPDDWQAEPFLKAVKRRLDTFIDQRLKVAVMVYREAVTDGYGNVITRVGYAGEEDDVEAIRQDVYGYYPYNSNPEVPDSFWTTLGEHYGADINMSYV